MRNEARRKYALAVAIMYRTSMYFVYICDMPAVNVLCNQNNTNNVGTINLRARPRIYFGAILPRAPRQLYMEQGLLDILQLREHSTYTISRVRYKYFVK